MTTAITSSSNTVYLMTGDIGGTNSRMSLYASNASCGSNDQPLLEKKFRNHEALPENVRSADPHAFAKYIIIPFLEYCWTEQQNEEKKPKLVPLEECTIVCCLAVAGIVNENKVVMTNLGDLPINGNAIPCYHKDKSEMSDVSLLNNAYLCRIVQCHIVNDFVAQGYGCLTLSSADVTHLYGPNIAPQDLNKGPKVCVGAGTGLGECYLTQSGMGDEGSMYTCFPSEGGHVEYAARNDVEGALFRYLNDKFSTKHRISVERVVSGTGLANVYEFLAQYYPKRVDAAFHATFLAAEPDKKPELVSQRAHKDYHSKTSAEEPSLCLLAMNIMMSAYGCEVGSAAIKWIPTGGLFVTGGLTPKNMQFIAGNGDHETEFMQSYLHKGRVSTLLERIPLYAVLVEDLGVRGAHKAAQMALEQYQQREQQH